MTQPRNASAIIKARRAGLLEFGDSIVVSFVGTTVLSDPHVFVDSGKSYDWRFAAGLHASMVVCPGVDAGSVMKDLFLVTIPYPSLIDFERKYVASVVDCPGGELKFWPRRTGSGPWQALFG